MDGDCEVNFEFDGAAHLVRSLAPLCCVAPLGADLPEQCPICLQKLEHQQRSWRLPCFHVFYDSCATACINQQRHASSYTLREADEDRERARVPSCAARKWGALIGVMASAIGFEAPRTLWRMSVLAGGSSGSGGMAAQWTLCPPPFDGKVETLRHPPTMCRALGRELQLFLRDAASQQA